MSIFANKIKNLIMPYNFLKNIIRFAIFNVKTFDEL